MENKSAKKVVILDRDGVINYDSLDYIKSPEEFIPLPGSLEAIAALNQAGYRVALATNQSGLARGLFTHETLEAMHNKLRTLLAELDGRIDFIAFCPHGPDEGCNCRKPRTGLLEEIASHFEISLEGVFFIGDTLKDIDAALKMGASPILVKTGKGKETLAAGVDGKTELIFDDLKAAVDWILSN